MQIDICLIKFFNSFQIYLAGFASNQRDKLNKILNVGGATRFDDMSDALTHVIIGDENRAASELKLMKSKELWYVNEQILFIIYYFIFSCPEYIL